MRTTMIVNPNAGRQNILRDLEGVRQILEKAGAEVTVEMTESAEQAAEAIRRAVESGPDSLICCGGDGTLSETVGCVLNSGASLTLGYIPAGTTNDFASSLGLPREPLKAAQLIAQGRERILDVGRFEDRSFIYVASFGAFTQASYSAKQNVKNALGHLAYVLEGLKELPALKPYHVRVKTAEGAEFENEYIFGALSNSTSVGGIVKLDPSEVDLGDGKLELILVKNPKNLAEFNRILGSVVTGKMDEEMITFVHTTGAEFLFEEQAPWSLDGEYAPGSPQVTAKVLPHAIRLFC